MRTVFNVAMVMGTMRTVFEGVVGMQVVDSRHTRECGQGENEYAVAALPWQDCRARYLSIILHRDSIRAATIALRRQFAVSAPVPCEAIFAEVINMYAGNLATALQQHGKTVRIGAPLNLAEYDFRRREMDVVHMLTESDILFKLCFSA